MFEAIAWLTLASAARFVLDGGHAHNEGPVTFETALTTVVAVLAVVGALWYFGYVGSAPEASGIDGEDDDRPDA